MEKMNLHNFDLFSDVHILYILWYTWILQYPYVALLTTVSIFSKLLDEFMEITKLLLYKKPLPHGVTHNIITCGPPVQCPPKWLTSEKFKTAK